MYCHNDNDNDNDNSLLNINVAMNCYERAQALTCYLICFDAIHYVRGPIMEAKKKRLRTYGHLINNIIGCNNIALDSMSKFNLKIETNFIKYCMG